jgi:phosphoglycolate phosphatase
MAGRQEFRLINLLWDLDGTLIDSMPVIAKCLNKTAEVHGVKPWSLDKIKSMIGPELGLMLKEMLSLTTSESIEEAKNVYRSYYQDCMSESEVFPGIFESITQLTSSGVTHYVATAKYQDYAQQILSQTILSDAFVGIYGSEENGILGNKTELLAHLLSEENLKASETIMIGDTKYDIEAGRSHNMTTIAVNWGYGSADELAAAGAHFYADSPEDLPEVVKKAMSCGC